MPSAWRVRVIEARLAREGRAARVRECDIYGLEGEERHAVLDAMLHEGAEPPFVLVDGRVVCKGDIDIEAVVAASHGAR